MSWLEKIENVKLEIITGDGVSYFPLWKNAEREIEFNTEAFNFSGVSGSYVARKLDSGFKLPLLLWFSGEDNTENADTFMESAKDPRPWTVKHPYYNEILVQPLSLKQSNREHNITEITGTIWETLASKFPSSKDRIFTPSIFFLGKAEPVIEQNVGSRSIVEAILLQIFPEGILAGHDIMQGTL